MIKLYLFLENREKNKKKNYGIRQITERNINKYQNDDGIVFMDVFDFLLDKDSI